MSVMRKALLWASTNQWIHENALQTGFVRRSVKKFMPGEKIEDAITAAVELKLLLQSFPNGVLALRRLGGVPVRCRGQQYPRALCVHTGDLRSMSRPTLMTEGRVLTDNQPARVRCGIQ